LHGRSAAGKSTLAALVATEMDAMTQTRCVLLDGDGFRKTVSSDLGFDPASRVENIRRAAQTAHLLASQGFMVLVAFETPTQHLRASARSLAGSVPFVEVALSCSLECCKRRDPKGLYAAATAHKLNALSGLDAPFDPPHSAELIIDTEQSSPAEAAQKIVAFLTTTWLSTPARP